jgi:uncharacterized protein (DUF924 family)
MTALNVPEVSDAILSYWFSSLDDAAALDREAEPFASCYARWYGKRPEIDAEIRARFEPVLHAVTRDGARWDRQVDAWRSVPQGLVALVILLDQFPRNMYRDTPGMYVHDPLALMVATLATREYAEASLSLVRWMFVYLPFMHAENLTVQQAMVRRFERLADVAVDRHPMSSRFSSAKTRDSESADVSGRARPRPVPPRRAASARSRPRCKPCTRPGAPTQRSLPRGGGRGSSVASLRGCGHRTVRL